MRLGACGARGLWSGTVCAEVGARSPVLLHRPFHRPGAQDAQAAAADREARRAIKQADAEREVRLAALRPQMQAMQQKEEAVDEQHEQVRHQPLAGGGIMHMQNCA